MASSPANSRQRVGAVPQKKTSGLKQLPGIKAGKVGEAVTDSKQLAWLSEEKLAELERYYDNATGLNPPLRATSHTDILYLLALVRQLQARVKALEESLVAPRQGGSSNP